MTDERRPVPDPATPRTSAQVDSSPVDPDDARRLARRRFFRSFAADAVRTAATVVGAANALRDQSAEMAGSLLGASPAAPATPAPPGTAGAGELAAAGPPAGFRSAFRFEPEALIVLDQRRLPEELVEVMCVSGSDAAQAIRESVIRGAPLLGQVAACGLALTAARSRAASPAARRAILFGTANALRNAAPTAAPVRNAMDRMLRRLAALAEADQDAAGAAAVLRAEAEAIIVEATLAHARLAANGAAFLADVRRAPDGPLRVLTIGSTGALAGGQVGTALAAVRALRDDGLDVRVLLAEGRPWLGGARLAAWELAQAGVRFALVSDGAAAGLLARGDADAVIVGADAIARDGAVACDPGGYGLAVVAARHAIPFLVAAPLSTRDGDAADGRGLRAEPRPAEELLSLRGWQIAPDGTPALNPSVDVIPAELVSAIATEAGLLPAPYAAALGAAADLGQGRA